MAKRTRTEIISQILEIAKDNAISKTRIMYGAYMSHAQVREYLYLLTEQGLIRHIKEENRYKTTKKGMNFLRAIDRANEMSRSNSNSEYDGAVILRDIENLVFR